MAMRNGKGTGIAKKKHNKKLAVDVGQLLGH